MRTLALLAMVLTAVPPYRLTAQIPPANQARVAWVLNPRVADGTWVSDASRHLQPATVDSLNAIISTLERETGDEIAVVVVDSLSGLTEQEFALAIHRGWGVGKRDRDNGLVFLWAPLDRKVFLSVGNGLEGVIPDRRAGRIRDQQIFANFRASRFDEGVLEGVRSLAAAAREETDPVRRAARHSGGGIGWFGIVAGIIGLFITGVATTLGWGRWKRRRPRRCANGHWMRLLDAREELSRLDKASQLEQQIHSLDWDVWLCDTCGDVQRHSYVHGHKWSECESCHRRTVKTRMQVIDQATTTSTGKARYTYICRNCGWKKSEDKVLAKVVPASSSSSSSSGSSWSDSGGGGGGSSFGGGSAGGGGAGGSY